MSLVHNFLGKYSFILNQEHNVAPSVDHVNALIKYLDWLPPSLLKHIHDGGWKVCFSPDRATLNGWYPDLASYEAFSGITVRSKESIYIVNNLIGDLTKATAQHELFHAIDISTSWDLVHISEVNVDFIKAFNEEKDLFPFASEYGPALPTKHEYFATALNAIFKYTELTNDEVKYNRCFGNCPLTERFCYDFLYTNPPTSLVDEAKNKRAMFKDILFKKNPTSPRNDLCIETYGGATITKLIPYASKEVAGCVRPGSNVNIDSNGVISVAFPTPPQPMGTGYGYVTDNTKTFASKPGDFTEKLTAFSVHDTFMIGNFLSNFVWYVKTDKLTPGQGNMAIQTRISGYSEPTDVPMKYQIRYGESNVTYGWSEWEDVIGSGADGVGLDNTIYTTNVSSGILTLTTKRLQKSNVSNNTEIRLPSVSAYTEIHLYFDTTTDLTLTLPNCRWQTVPTIKANKSYEMIFTYTDKWLGGFIEYGN